MPYDFAKKDIGETDGPPPKDTWRDWPGIRALGKAVERKPTPLPLPGGSSAGTSREGVKEGIPPAGGEGGQGSLRPRKTQGFQCWRTMPQCALGPDLLGKFHTAKSQGLSFTQEVNGDRIAIPHGGEIKSAPLQPTQDVHLGHQPAFISL